MKKTFLILLVLLCAATMAVASVSAASDDIASDDAIQSSIDDNAINEVTLETDDSVSDSIDDAIQADMDSSDDKSLGASPLKDGGTNIYVSTTGDDSNDGLSEATAVATVAKGYELASDGSTINIAAGTYDQSSSITLDKSITFNGADGAIVNRAGTANVFTYSEDAPITVTLNNLIFTATSTASNPVINIGGGATLNMDKCTLMNMSTTGRNGVLKFYGNAIGKITNCDFSNFHDTSSASSMYLNIGGSSVVDINSSKFYDIDAGTYLRSIVYVTSGTATLNLENSVFSNITGKIYGIVENKAGYLNLKNCTFKDINVDNSVLKGIVYISETNPKGNSNIIANSFYDNNANYAIWISAAPTTVEYNAFDLAEGQYAIGNNKNAEVTVNYNFFGTNDNPSALLDNVTASNWVIMSASASADTVAVGEDITITADFSKYTDGTTVSDLTGTMAEVPVKFTNADDTKGSIGEVAYENNKAIVSYTGVAEGADTVTVTAASISTTIPITVTGGSAPIGNTIYVKPDGNDESSGLSENDAVKTIAKAVELAQAGDGQVIIMEGTYNENNITINSEIPLTITGQGDVMIDGTGLGSNSIFLIKTSQPIVIENIKFTNNKAKYGSAINVAGSRSALLTVDLTIDNCVFDKLEGASSSRGGAIYCEYLDGKFTIDNSAFTNTNSTGWGGALCVAYSAYENGLNLIINNTLFENNSGNNGGGAYLAADKITIENCNFISNKATYSPGALYLYNCTAAMKNCTLVDNHAKNTAAAIAIETVSNQPTATLTITNSVIENNTGLDAQAAAINVNKATLDVSYSSLVNDLSINTITATGYGAVYGQGMAIADYNWWGTHDPTTAVNGTNITIDKWVIMNVDPTSKEGIEIGDTVSITVDFNHYTDSTATVYELDGSIPERTVSALATTGTLDKAEAITENGIVQFTYTAAAGGEDTVNIASGAATVPVTITVNMPIPPHDVYVSKDGNDENNGSEDAPVATIAKAIEIASSDAGTGLIYINEGTYTETGFTVSKDLTITGIGNVIIDANNESAKMFTVGSDVASFAVNNVAITKANQNYGAVLYNNYNANVLLNNVTISDCYANGWSGSALIVSKGSLTIKDSTISDNGPISSVIYNNGGTLIINNTAFENIAANTSTSCNGAIESTGNTNVIIENSNFINIGAVRGAIYSGASDSGSLTIICSNFENCSALLDGNNFGYGGAVHSQVALTIDKSTFLNSKSYRDGASVYVTKAAAITNSVFMGGDSQDGDTAEIYATGDLTLNNNILLKSSDDKYLVKTGSGTVNAKNNYWGSNDPSALVSGFTLENWVIMNVEPTATQGSIGQATEINIDFKHTSNAEGTIADLEGSLPEELTVSADSANGTVGGIPVTTADLAGSIIFIPEFGGENIVYLYTDANNKVPVTITVSEPYTGIIYVSKDGSDSNNGAEDAPVATIAKAVELAKEGSGQIIIKEGTYNENNITIDGDKSISITGEGNVIIDGTGLGTNSIFTVLSGVVSFENIAFTNNKARYGAAIYTYGSSQSNLLALALVINNCTFDSLEATSRGGAIYAYYTKGNLIINNSKFTNNIASSWGGAICTAYSAYENGLHLKITDSSFENNGANNGGAGYLMADRITIENSNFTSNNATYYPGALELYNCTATIDNCIFKDNNASKQSAAIKVEGVKGQPITTAVITNSIIENNVGLTEKAAAIYADKSTVEVSYCSIVNEHNLETVTSTGYDAVYGQGMAIVNNNWWGTNDPSAKVNGTNITMDKWVIMNVESNATDVLPGDEVKLTVDFNHVMTTAGEIEELTGGVIPKDSYTVTFVAENGTVSPETLTVNKGESGEAVFTASDANSKVTAACDDAIKEIIFEGEIPEPYTGIVYVSTDGSDRNNGSAEAPVASIAKAIQIATAETGSGQIVIKEGTYKGTDYLITKDLTITGEGNVVIDGEGQGRLFYMNYPSDVAKFSISNVTLTGASYGYGAAVYSLAKETSLDNVKVINNPGAGDLITASGNLTVKDSLISGHNGGDAIQTSGDGTVIINNTVFENNVVTSSSSDFGIVYISSGKVNLIVENSKFINNTARQGVLVGSNDANITVKGSEFINNTNTVAYGGAIRAQSKLDVTESIFINNKAAKDGGAIYIGWRGDATITKSEFINNSAGTTYNGDAIYNGNKATVNYCILLTNATGKLIFNDGEDNVVNAQYNWWGTNDNPKSLTGYGTYEDDYGYDEIDCAEVDVSNWIVMNVVADTSNVQTGAEIPITVDFNHYLDSTTSEIKELNDKLAQELTVDFATATGSLDKTSVETTDLVAQATYTAAEGQNSINVQSSNAIVGLEFSAVTPKDTVLNAEEEITVNFGEGNLNVTLLSDGTPIAGKSVTVKVNDEITLNGITDEFGIANIDLSSVPIGTYNAAISFAGDSQFNPSTGAVKITVKEAPKTAEELQRLIDETPAGGVLNLSNMEFADISGIDIDKDIAIVGDNVSIASAGDGEPVFNIASNVSNVSISGVEFIANNGDVLVKATASNGTDDLSIVNPAIELTNNTVTPASDDVVASSVTLFELESERAVLAPSNPINIADNNLPEGAKAFDFEIAGLDNGNGINIPVGGNINTNGTGGNNNTNGSSGGSPTAKVATSIVKKNMKTTTVNTKINGKKAGKNFSITLKDKNGNVLAGKQVLISINGKVYKRTTNAKGVASIKVALSKKGTYPVVVSFLGDDKYNGSFAVAKVKVNPQKVKLTVAKKKYKASKKTKYLYATLKAANKKAIKGKKLVFIVNKKKYTAKTNKKGVAKVKVKLSKKKTYKFKVKFAGDNTFKKAAKKGKVVIK